MSQTTDGVTTSNLVSRNRLLSDGKYNYTYDDNGNRTQKLEIASGDYQDFAWDHRNRLTSIEFRDSAGTLQQAVRYSYDAFDQRILSELDADGDGTFEQFDRAVWDRSEVALVLDDAGAVQHRFLHGPGVDQVFADESATDGLLWYLTDNQNSVRDVIDSSGTLLNHLSYSTFGKITAESDPNQTPYFAYTGREFDEVTGLQYNRARYYDAETGRWLNNDPIGFAAGDTNIQRYVGNSPTNYTDPSGLFSSGDNNHNLGKREAAVERLAEILARIARLEVMQNSGRWPEGSYVMGLIQATLNSLDAEIDALEKLFPGGEVKFINDQLDGLNGAKRLEDLRDGMNAAADEFEKEMKKYAKKCAIEAGLAYVGGKAASTVFKKASAYLKSRRKFRELQEKLRKQKRRPKTDQSQGGEFVDDALRTPAANTPFRPNSLKHIFRPKHNLVDTPGNRKLLRAIADDAASFVGKNKHGNEVFQRLMPDGSQIWVWVRNGKIFDGGRNLIPKIFP